MRCTVRPRLGGVHSGNGDSTWSTGKRRQTCRQTTRKKLRELFDGIYNEYIVDIYQNAHSNALKNSWDNGWSGGLLLLAVSDDAAARADRRCALMQHALAAAARLYCCHNYNYCSDTKL